MITQKNISIKTDLLQNKLLKIVNLNEVIPIKQLTLMKFNNKLL